MKIHILGVRGLPSSYSGYETFVSELAPGLVNQGHEVTVYCRRALFREKPKTFNGVRLLYVPSVEHKAFSTLTHSALSMFIACIRKADVILVVNVANGALGLVSRMFKRPAIINTDGLEWERPKWNSLARKYFRFGARVSGHLYDCLISDSKVMQEIYEREFGHKSVYIPYGARPYYSQKPERLDEIGVFARQYFLIVARRVPDNNGDILVEGFVRSDVDAPLVVVGGAEYRGNRTERDFYDHLVSIADERVKFIGQVTDRELLSELWANCFGYLHGHQHGGTNPSLLQALAHGCFVLAIDSPFSREVLADGEFGEFFTKTPRSLAPLLEEYWNAPASAQAFRDRARNRIENRYSWESVISQYVDLFTLLTQKAST